MPSEFRWTRFFLVYFFSWVPQFNFTSLRVWATRCYLQEEHSGLRVLRGGKCLLLLPSKVCKSQGKLDQRQHFLLDSFDGFPLCTAFCGSYWSTYALYRKAQHLSHWFPLWEANLKVRGLWPSGLEHPVACRSSPEVRWCSPVRPWCSIEQMFLSPV